MSRHNIDPGLIAWLGSAFDELTDEQIERVAAASRDIDRRYPDEDEDHLRDTALSAVVQYLQGDTSPTRARAMLGAARTEEAKASAAAQQIAILLVEDGRSEVQAAQAVGIDRMTLRKALGK